MLPLKTISIRTLFAVLCLWCAGAQAQTRDSLDIKIGQMILIGFPGTEVDQKVLREIREGKVGSIIIFEKEHPSAKFICRAEENHVRISAGSYNSSLYRY